MIEEVIFSNLLYNEDYVRQVVPHLKSEYFYDPTQRRIYNYCSKFFERYNKLPTPAVLSVALERDSKVNENEYSEGIAFINSLSRDISATEWLVNETETFCKERALYNSLSLALEIKENAEKNLDQQNKKLPDVNAIPGLLQEALGVSFDKNVGHDYFEDADKRWQVYHDKQSKIPFDIDILNTITNGGVEYKTLNVLLMGVNVGKSIGLCHLAASYVAMGHDVLYISMEMGEIQGVAKRIDANMFNMNIEHVMNLDPGTYNTRIKRVKENVTGKLVIKQYPTGAAHVGHFKALLNELKMKKNFKPRIIMVDYLGIMASTRIKGYSENTYSLVKSIAEELRGFAIENDLCIWSAAQTTRGAWGNSDIEMGDTAESAGLPATVDLLLGGLETEETIALGQQMFKQLKSRYGNKDIFTKFMIGVDKDKQKWYDVAEFTRTPRSTSEEQRAVVPSKVQPLKNKKIDVSGWDFGEQEKPKEPEKIKFDKDFSEKDIPF